eukprot:scaffold502806_cov37-Prasinocladus_malaysianus.AAC.1
MEALSKSSWSVADGTQASDQVIDGVAKEERGLKFDLAVAGFVAQMSPQIFRTGGFAQPSSLESVLKRFDESTGPLRRFVLGSYYVMFGAYTLRAEEKARIGAKVIAAYRAAGSPRDAKASGGMCHITFATLMVANAEVQIGQITGGPGHRAKFSELPLLGLHDQAAYYVPECGMEGMWEPPHSARITNLATKLAELLPKSKVCDQ